MLMRMLLSLDVMWSKFSHQLKAACYSLIIKTPIITIRAGMTVLILFIYKE